MRHVLPSQRNCLPVLLFLTTFAVFTAVPRVLAFGADQIDDNSPATARTVYVQVVLTGHVVSDISAGEIDPDEEALIHKREMEIAREVVSYFENNTSLKVPWQMVPIDSAGQHEGPFIQIQIENHVSPDGQIENWRMNVKTDSGENDTRVFKPIDVLEATAVRRGRADHSRIAQVFKSRFIAPAWADKEFSVRREMWQNFPLADAYIDKTTVPLADESQRDLLGIQHAILRLSTAIYRPYDQFHFRLECERGGLGGRIFIKSKAFGHACKISFDGQHEECLVVIIEDPDQRNEAIGENATAYFHQDNFRSDQPWRGGFTGEDLSEGMAIAGD